MGKCKSLLTYATAGAIRFWLINSEYKQLIVDRVEVSTPLNSWKRVTEGTYLFKEGLSPYAGDMYHETPLGLVVFDFLINNCSQWLSAIFIFCDLLTGYLLHKVASHFMQELKSRENEEKVTYAKDVKSILLKEEDLRSVPNYVAAAYLFSPYTVFSCVGQTTTVFANLCLATTFLAMVQGRGILCCIALALAAYQSVYPISFLVPASVYIARKTKRGSNGQYDTRINPVMKTIITFMVMFFGLLWISSEISQGWEFLNATYGFIFSVPDLRPNVGLFWYFFTEMFEHFRNLFICAFQINAFLYVIPLTIRFYHEPMLLTCSLCALVAIFKSYPSIGDIGFYLALFPMWKHLFNYMQQGFIVGCFFLITSVLGPILWHLWIYSRSANANFYFGVTLAFATAQIFLVTDILFAYIKREFFLHHGLKKEINGKAAKLALE